MTIKTQLECGVSVNSKDVYSIADPTFSLQENACKFVSLQSWCLLNSSADPSPIRNGITAGKYPVRDLN